MYLNRGRAKSNSLSDHRGTLTASSKTRNKRILTESANSEARLKANETYYMKGDHATLEREEQVFTRTAQQLSGNNFGHHQEGGCCCADCECGRHLCKFNVIKPGFTKKTVYRRSYYKQKPVRNEVNHDKEYDRLRGPHLDMKSTYSEGFKATKPDDLSRPHPEDLLHPHGPAQQITSYGHQFPGFHGDNQYVKPTDRHAIAYFPLRGKSTYSQAYVQKPPAKDDYTYIPDQLRTGSQWLGRTTYGELYSQPNSAYFAKKVKVVEERRHNPDDSLQYRNYATMQEGPAIKRSSRRSRTRSVRPRSSSRLEGREPSPHLRPILQRTVTSRHFRRSSTPSPTRSTRMSDLILLTDK
jgi:hypothetical protein